MCALNVYGENKEYARWCLFYNKCFQITWRIVCKVANIFAVLGEFVLDFVPEMPSREIEQNLSSVNTMKLIDHHTWTDMIDII